MSGAALLDQYALVLNRNWLAVGVTPVRHAVSLLFMGHASVIHPETFEAHDFSSWADLSAAETEYCIRGVNLQIRVPEIVVLRFFNGFPARKVVFSRRNLFRRDQYTCQYCGKKPESDSLTVDHLIPRSRGGRSTWENCILACSQCNAKKGNRTPNDSGMRPMRPPMRPHWIPYFSIPISHRRVSWEKFVSDVYWNSQLEE